MIGRYAEHKLPELLKKHSKIPTQIEEHSRDCRFVSKIPCYQLCLEQYHDDYNNKRLRDQV